MCKRARLLINCNIWLFCENIVNICILQSFLCILCCFLLFSFVCHSEQSEESALVRETQVWCRSFEDPSLCSGWHWESFFHCHSEPREESALVKEIRYWQKSFEDPSLCSGWQVKNPSVTYGASSAQGTALRVSIYKGALEAFLREEGGTHRVTEGACVICGFD